MAESAIPGQPPRSWGALYTSVYNYIRRRFSRRDISASWIANGAVAKLATNPAAPQDGDSQTKLSKVVAYNDALKQLRAKKRENDRLRKFEPTPQPSVPEDVIEKEEQTKREKNLERLEAAMNELPADLREVLELHYPGKTDQQIAEIKQLFNVEGEPCRFKARRLRDKALVALRKLLADRGELE
jgi:RNA polymerase sigma factor (sigma-70 family)